LKGLSITVSNDWRSVYIIYAPLCYGSKWSHLLLLHTIQKERGEIRVRRASEASLIIYSDKTQRG
jgi:hypothetical protein